MIIHSVLALHSSGEAPLFVIRWPQFNDSSAVCEPQEFLLSQENQYTNHTKEQGLQQTQITGFCTGLLVREWHRN